MLDLKSVFRALGVDDCITVYRSLEEDQTWIRYQLDAPDTFPDEELLGEQIVCDRILSYYLPQRFLRLDIGNCPSVQLIAEALESEIPAGIRGVYRPLELCIVIGSHDLMTTDDNAKPTLLARATISIQFDGYAMPADPYYYRDLLPTIGAVSSLKQAVESHLGPLTEDCLWSL